MKRWILKRGVLKSRGIQREAISRIASLHDDQPKSAVRQNLESRWCTVDNVILVKIHWNMIILSLFFCSLQ